MSKLSKQLLILCLVVGISIFFGVDLATRGIERIQGPFLPAVSSASAQQQQPRQGATRPNEPGFFHWGASERKQVSPPPPPRPLVSEDSLINRFANKTGELLQILAYYGIKWVTSVLNGLIG